MEKALDYEESGVSRHEMVVDLLGKLEEDRDKDRHSKYKALTMVSRIIKRTRPNDEKLKEVVAEIARLGSINTNTEGFNNGYDSILNMVRRETEAGGKRRRRRTRGRRARKATRRK